MDRGTDELNIPNTCAKVVSCYPNLSLKFSRGVVFSSFVSKAPMSSTPAFRDRTSTLVVNRGNCCLGCMPIKGLQVNSAIAPVAWPSLFLLCRVHKYVISVWTLMFWIESCPHLDAH